MKTKLAPAEYKCRFPGCDHPSYSRPQDRGRHESLVHNMRGGIVPPSKKPAGAAPKPDPVAVVRVEPIAEKERVESKIAEPFAHPRLHLDRAIEQLNARESELTLDIDRMERLKLERDQIGRQKEILSTALEALNKDTPAAEHVAPVTLANHGASRAHSSAHAGDGG